MNDKKNILMVAAENDALVGGKVGGIGDVVRDVPIALADQGCLVDVLTPAYQLFSTIPGAEEVASFGVFFAGTFHPIKLFSVPPRSVVPGVRHWAMELPSEFYGSSSGIYCNDPPTAPFATDATKFACFCTAVSTAIVSGVLSTPDIIHLHDWHSAFLLLLRDSDPEFSDLKKIRCVYTVHNLALQGTRPLSGHDSSLHSWFPGLDYQPVQIVDRYASQCINPMRAGIILADKVHVVSPTYANEILLPSDPEKGFVGGEGLQDDLIAAKSDDRLVGILNGCDYPETKYKKLTKKSLAELLGTEILSLINKRPVVESSLFTAQVRVSSWLTQKRPEMLVTSVGRITDQKVTILQQELASGISALEALLLELGDEGRIILLGSGDADLEQFLTGMAGRYENLVFVKGYSEKLADALYHSGDLFLMPSSFEPCGISQMLSMRAGQPCLVHSVGGLIDTVIDDTNGFCFQGDSVEQQAENLVARFTEVKRLRQESPKQYSIISNNARAARFSWQNSAERYISELYSF